MASMNILAAIVYPKQTLITLVPKLQDLVGPKVLSVRVVLIAFVQLYMCTICITKYNDNLMTRLAAL